MRFCQIDRITTLEPGVRIEATRKLRADEDYLRDHFPRFEVMPGVLMLEALTQAAILLARATEGYKFGLVYLESAKNVKFADFVQPGQTLSISVEIIKRTECTTLVKAAVRAGILRSCLRVFCPGASRASCRRAQGAEADAQARREPHGDRGRPRFGLLSPLQRACRQGDPVPGGPAGRRRRRFADRAFAFPPAK